MDKRKWKEIYMTQKMFVTILFCFVSHCQVRKIESMKFMPTNVVKPQRFFIALGFRMTCWSVVLFRHFQETTVIFYILMEFSRKKVKKEKTRFLLLPGILRLGKMKKAEKKKARGGFSPSWDRWRWPLQEEDSRLALGFPDTPLPLSAWPSSCVWSCLCVWGFFV